MRMKASRPPPSTHGLTTRLTSRTLWAWLVLYVITQPVTSHYCKPAAEGETFQVDFRSKVNTSTFAVVWRVTSATGVSRDMSYCLPGQHTCNDPWQEFTAWQRVKDDDVTYSLNISRVNFTHRGMQLELGSLDRRELFAPHFACVMDVFSRPRDPVCHVTEVTPGRLHVTYRAAQVFPRVSCLMSQYEIGTRTSTDIKGDVIEVEHQKQGKYFSVHCEAFVEIHQPGTYAFTTFIEPRLAGKLSEDFDLIRPINSRLINVTGNDRGLHITQPDGRIDICQGDEKNVEFVCEAFGFQSKDVFTWKHGAEFISSNAITSKQAPMVHRGKIHSRHQSRLNMKVSKTMSTKLIECHAQDSGSNYQIKTYLDVRLAWPPASGGKFLHEDGTNFNFQERVFPEGSDVQLKCVVDGGYPQVERTEVKCTRTKTNTALENIGQALRFSSESHTVLFTLRGQAKESFTCMCLYIHVTSSSCKPTPPTWVTISFQRFESVNKMLENSEKSGRLANVPWIVLAVVACCCVVAIFIVVYRCRNKRVLKYNEPWTQIESFYDKG